LAPDFVRRVYFGAIVARRPRIALTRDIFSQFRADRRNIDPASSGRRNVVVVVPPPSLSLSLSLSLSRPDPSAAEYLFRTGDRARDDYRVAFCRFTTMLALRIARRYDT